jgi:hypothetical protein
MSPHQQIWSFNDKERTRRARFSRIDANTVNHNVDCGRPRHGKHRAIWMAVASLMLIALSTRCRTAFGPHPHRLLPVMVAEGSFVSLLIGCIAAYWFPSEELRHAQDARKTATVI